MSPKVSVIIPTYNRASLLPRAIDSVIGQSFQNFEVIIVDDGSTDGTADLLKSYANKSGVRVFTTSNKGVSAARNLGIGQAKADWVAFLDSDDEWLPSKLEIQNQWVKDNPSIDLVHGEEIWIRNGVRVNPMNKHQKSGGDVFSDAVRLCCISPSTVMLKKSLFQEVGLFREDYPVCEDYDLWLKITAHKLVGFVEDSLIKKYGGHEDQLSRKFFAMDYWRIKSLDDLLRRGNLSEEKAKVARSELAKKAKILLKGYRKHQNLSQYQEIFNYLIN